MIWGLFLVAGMTLERGRHIAMTSALMLLRPPLQLAVRRLIGVVGAVFCGYFTYLASRMTLFVFSTGQVIPSLNLSSAYLYRSEEHTSELQSLMRISYAVFCLKKKRKLPNNHTIDN